jgi:hypothetical protein
VIRKALPKKPEEDIQIYTPTTVISIRGTSFLTQVTPKTGTTGIKVICGTVRVRCIKENASAFVSAPFKTIVEKNTTPIVTTALLTKDIDSLKTWVPKKLVESEVAQHLANGKRDQMIISGRMEEKCVITTFLDSTKYKGPWDIRKTIPKLLLTRLKNVHTRLKVSVPDSTFNSPADAAKKAGARFVISGVITQFAILHHAQITVQADEYREKSIGRISIELQLYDAKGEIEPYSVTVTGERTGKKNTTNSWMTIDKMPLDFENEEFAGSIIGKALEQALETAVEKLTHEMFK